MKRRLLALACPPRSVCRRSRGPRPARTCCRSTARRRRATRRSPPRRPNWEATQEKLPQAHAGLLPNASVSASANYNNYDATIKSDPRQDIYRNFGQFSATVRRRSRCTATRTSSRTTRRSSRSRSPTTRSHRAAGPDHPRRRRLFRRAARAVQHRAGREPEEGGRRSSSRRPSATSRSAWRRSPTPTRRRRSTTRSSRRRSRRATTTTTGVTALRAIIGRYPKDLKKLGPRLPCRRRPSPTRSTTGSTSALKENLNVRIAAVQLRDRDARGRARARRPLPDARPRRQLHGAGRERRR